MPSDPEAWGAWMPRSPEQGEEVPRDTPSPEQGVEPAPQPMQASGRAVQAGPTAAEVEAFVSSNNVDDKVAKALREAAGYVKTRVMGRGRLRTARNPSSALMCRLRDAMS